MSAGPSPTLCFEPAIAPAYASMLRQAQHGALLSKHGRQWADRLVSCCQYRSLHTKQKLQCPDNNLPLSESGNSIIPEIVVEANNHVCEESVLQLLDRQGVGFYTVWNCLSKGEPRSGKLSIIAKDTHNSVTILSADLNIEWVNNDLLICRVRHCQRTRKIWG